jgi:hypothetical protein
MKSNIRKLPEADIRATIKALESSDPIDDKSVRKRRESIKEELKGSAPQDLLLKCWECGDRFTFTVDGIKLKTK